MEPKLVKTKLEPGLQSRMPDFTKEEPWRIFRIMAEFVEAFEEMSKQGPLVTIFGSARTSPSDKYYMDAERLGKLLSDRGYGILTGGGPGIMEAGNKGAYEAGGISVGLNIKLPMEQKPNPFQTTGVDFRYFFIRKVCFLKYSVAAVVYPGGYGTIDEFSEAITLIQTDKVNKIPVVLVGKEFWSPLVKWFEDTLLRDKKISSPDLELFKLVDSADEAFAYITECHSKCGMVNTIKDV